MKKKVPLTSRIVKHFVCKIFTCRLHVEAPNVYAPPSLLLAHDKVHAILRAQLEYDVHTMYGSIYTGQPELCQDYFLFREFVPFEQCVPITRWVLINNYLYISNE